MKTEFRLASGSINHGINLKYFKILGLAVSCTGFYEVRYHKLGSK